MSSHGHQGTRFGQRPPPISKLIKDLLKKYPNGQIFKVSQGRHRRSGGLANAVPLAEAVCDAGPLFDQGHTHLINIPAYVQ